MKAIAASPYLWGALPVLLWFVQYLVRRYLPNLWERFANLGPFGSVDAGPVLMLARKAWQALPSAVAGAVVLAAMTGGDVHAAALGAIKGALAPLLHEVLKWSPLPYQGATLTGKLPVSALLVFLLAGCAPARSLPPPCPAIEQLKLDAKIAQVKAGCDDDPMGECPALVAEYEAKVDAVPDEACP